MKITLVHSIQHDGVFVQASKEINSKIPPSIGITYLVDGQTCIAERIVLNSHIMVFSAVDKYFTSKVDFMKSNKAMKDNGWFLVETNSASFSRSSLIDEVVKIWKTENGESV